MAQIRVMHYLNQFFAGIGGEDKADVRVGSQAGPLGPGKRLQDLLGDSAKIVVTTYCGDNYFAEHTKEALASVLQIAKEQNVELLIAGPAFAAGRYGFACVEVCHSLGTSLDLYGVSGMHVENPGMDVYRQYKDRRLFILPTADVITGMEDALSRMARFAAKLASGQAIGTASDKGYVPRGIRIDEVESKSGAERVVDMLLNKLAGRPFATEIPIESLEAIPVPLRITNLKDACLALACTGGVTALGNPDGFKVLKNAKWNKYPIDKLNSMKDSKWDVIHGGYNTAYMYDNPNYGVPVDASRALERDGVFAQLYPYFYGTSGVSAEIVAMQAAGREMVSDMKAGGVAGVLMVSTWGSCTRGGAVISREIERAGMPVAHITAMSMMAKQLGANRVVTGTKIPHPCGDPNLSAEADLALRKEIVKTALSALQTDVNGPTIFVPDIAFTSG